MNDLYNPNHPLNETTFAVFDVETTGLSPHYGDRVCEVGCLRVRGGRVLERFDSLVDPRRSISPGAFRVNRITPEMLRDAPTFDAVAERLLQVMDGAVWVAHNAPFDLGFLSAELGLIGQPLPQHPVVDTLMLARRAFHFTSNSLSAVAAVLKISGGPAHRALGDVQTTFGVLEWMRQDLAQRQRVTTLGQLIALQGGPVAIPNQKTAHELSLPPLIAEALENGGRVRMRYMDAQGRESERVVRPLHVRARGKTLYLIAHCYRRDAQRTFRLDRVVELTPER